HHVQLMEWIVMQTHEHKQFQKCSSAEAFPVAKAENQPRKTRIPRRNTVIEENRPNVQLEIALFGACEVRLRGEEVSFAPRKAKWVLVLLALASTEGRSLTRSEISRVLWPWADGT